MSPRRVIGIDAGGTKLLGGVVDEELSVRHRVHRLWRGRERQEVLDVMVDAVEEARAAAPDAVAAGIGIPALVDADSGASAFSVHLPLEGVPFRDLMQERLGLPVFVDNDANLAAVAEQRAGAARGASHVAMLTLGTGIGGGLILGGRLYRGAHGGAAELGHVVVDIDGPPCQGGCPGRGCLEVMASGTAIGREGLAAAEREPDSALGAELREGREITGARVTELAHDGDPAAVGVLRLIGERLGAGIVGIVNTFNPEVVVVGGGAVAGGDLLLDPARAVVAQRALPPSRDQVRVVAAGFGEEAGLIGAAVLALEDGRVS
jgi:glucokinase